MSYIQPFTDIPRDPIKTKKDTKAFCGYCHSNSTTYRYSFIINKALYSKYSSSQNYHFTKDINDIISDISTQNTLIYKDYLAYDDDEEYLKRYYQKSEYNGKITLLTEYYKFHRDICRLFMLPTTKTLNKYHDKKRRIEYVRITKMLNKENEAGDVSKTKKSSLVKQIKKLVNPVLEMKDVKSYVQKSVFSINPKSQLTRKKSETLADMKQMLGEILNQTFNHSLNEQSEITESIAKSKLNEFLGEETKVNSLKENPTKTIQRKSILNQKIEVKPKPMIKSRPIQIDHLTSNSGSIFEHSRNYPKAADSILSKETKLEGKNFRVSSPKIQLKSASNFNSPKVKKSPLREKAKSDRNSIITSGKFPKENMKSETNRKSGIDFFKTSSQGFKTDRIIFKETPKNSSAKSISLSKPTLTNNLISSHIKKGSLNLEFQKNMKSKLSSRDNFNLIGESQTERHLNDKDRIKKLFAGRTKAAETSNQIPNFSDHRIIKLDDETLRNKTKDLKSTHHQATKSDTLVTKKIDINDQMRFLEDVKKAVLPLMSSKKPEAFTYNNNIVNIYLNDKKTSKDSAQSSGNFAKNKFLNKESK